MSVFSLSAGLNRTNNPSANGVFEYGYWNNALTVFTRFNQYGYTDGSTFNPSLPFDNTKILGWYTSAGTSPHVSVAFENLNGNVNITPQPFPSFGVYMHPGGISGVDIQNVGIRIHIPNNGQISLTGTIQAATTGGCGSNVGYRVLKNMTTSLIARTNLPKSASPTSISIPTTGLVAGDIVDIIIDYGDDLTDFCDDTALNLTLTVDLFKIAKPLRVGNPTCESDELIYIVPLQQTGTVELYRNGILVDTQTISASGADGVVNFSGAYIYSGGTYHAIAKNTGQDDSDPSNDYLIEQCCALEITTQPVSTTRCNGNPVLLLVIATGDPTITYQWYKDNVLITGATANSYNATTSGTYHVVVTNDCTSVTSNDAVITIGITPTVLSGLPLSIANEGQVYNHQIVFNTDVTQSLHINNKPSWLTITFSSNIVTLNGTPPITGTESYPINFDIETTSGCNYNADLELDINTSIDCNASIAYTINCNITIQSVSVRRIDEITGNRFLQLNNGRIYFTADEGTNDYLIVITNSNNKTHTFKILNFVCFN